MRKNSQFACYCTAIALGLIVVLLSACTQKNAGNTASIKIYLPAVHLRSESSAGVRSLGAITNGWGLNDPTTTDELQCYFVAVGSSDADLSDNSCLSASGRELAQFGVATGLAAAGSEISLTTTPGTHRTIYVFGFHSTSAGACVSLSSPIFSRAELSAPMLVASKTVDLTPGTNSVELTTSIDGTQSASRCRGPLFSSRWDPVLTPLPSPTPTATPVLTPPTPVPTTTPTPTPTPSVSLTNSSLSISSASLTSGSTATVTLTTRDANNAQFYNPAASVAFNLSGGGSSGGFSNFVDHGDGTYTTDFSATTAGSPATIGATIDASGLANGVNVQVLPGAVSLSQSIVTATASSLAVGENFVLTLTAKDAYANLLLVGGGTVAFSNVGGTSTGTFGMTIDNGNGTYSALFSGTGAGSATTVVATFDGQTVTSAPVEIQVTPALPSATLSLFTSSAATLVAGTAANLTVTVKDLNGNVLSPGGHTVTFSLSGGTSGGTFSPVTDNGDGTYSATFTGEVAGSNSTMSATINGTTLSTTLPMIVTPAAASKFIVSGPTTIDASTCSGPYQVTVTDAFSNAVNLTSDETPTLTPGAIEFLASDCATPVSTTIPSASSSFEFYVRSELTGNQVITAAGSYATGTLSINVLPKMAALGANISPVWGATTGVPVRGKFDGMLSGPTDTASDGTYLYVLDSGNARIVRYSISGNAPAGWMGTVDQTPTGGDAGCTALSAGQLTNGWCTGGSSKVPAFYSGNGQMRMPQGLATDGASLFVADTGQHRVLRFSLSGVFTGWIGVASTTPTGGGAGCVSVPAGGVAPAWCLGGAGSLSSGSALGAFNSPRGIRAYAGYLYVVDSSNNRVVKVDATSGQTLSWIGRITTISSGADPACPNPSSNTPTNGWCSINSPATFAATAGGGVGEFSGPYALDTDGTSLFVGDQARIAKFDLASGVFQGWVGQVSATPSGGASGCTSTTSSNVTPGWCTGGTAGTNNGAINNGGMYIPAGIRSDATYLYMTEQYPTGRLYRFNKSTGAFGGWFGLYDSGTTSGCPTPSAGQITNGWCSGGNSRVGNRVGSLNYTPGSLNGLEIIGTTLYIGEGGAHRVQMIDATGAALGFIGAQAVAAPKWNLTATASMFGSVFGPAFMFWDQIGTAPTPMGSLTVAGGSLFAADTGSNSLKEFDLLSGNFLGWTGDVEVSPTTGASGCSSTPYGQPTPGFCLDGIPKQFYSNPVPSPNGSLMGPRGVTADASYAYVLEGFSGRISRYSLPSGAFAGWIGRVSSTPTGGASGCVSTTSGLVTPGWCTGGQSVANSTGDGSVSGSARALASDATYLYVLDAGGYHLSRYVAATGAFAGWTGKIATVPTGGAAGCTSASVSSFTPGWCTGGTSASSNAGGGFANPQAIATDTNFIYVADAVLPRVSRFNLSSGVFAGWIGRTSAAITSDPGCGNVSANAYTPAWCMTGTASSSAMATGAGFPWPSGLAVDNGNLFVVDQSHNVALKLDASTGQILGWKGTLGLSSITGGDAGCTSTPIGTFTPGWCTGGTSVADDGLGISMPIGLAIYGDYLLIGNAGNGRVLRVPK